MKRYKNDIELICRGLRKIHEICPWILFAQIFRAAFSAVSPFVNIYMSALIINFIAAKKSFRVLAAYAFITIVLNLFVALITRLMNRLINILLNKFEQRYLMTLSQKIMEMDYENVEDPETHRLKQKIDDARNMSGGGIWRVYDSFQSLIQNFFVILFSAVLTFSLFAPSAKPAGTNIFHVISSPAFSGILGACILINVVVSMYANSTVTKKMYEIFNDIIPFNRIFGYYLNNYITAYDAGKDIRLYNQKHLISSESMSLFGGSSHALDRISKNQIKYTNLSTIFTVTISTLVYLFVGLKALAGLFGIGLIVQYVGSINQFTNGFAGFMSELAALRSNNECLKLYFDFLDIPSKMYQGTLPVEKRSDNEYEIEFRDVSFKYPGAEQYALRNLNLKLNVGQRLAVVGRNGSGKTTMIKLLCRLYDPTEGAITLNGIDIRKYNYEEYMSIFSVVFQNFRLFSYSLGQNVAACVDYDKKRAEAALEKVGFGSRLSAMPKGLETPLYKDFEEDGVEISGGEAQKIALARALYKDAPFIVLDEPTAALDPIAEYEIYSKFNEIVGNKTAVYISHRLSSCRFCDVIAVFDNGRLIQRGGHDELLRNENGLYYELWNAQAQYYTEKADNADSIR